MTNKFQKGRVALLASIFDVLHFGHIRLLERMRAEADLVVVVIHDDISTYNIKKKIPIHSIEKRVFNTIATGLVDKVIICTDVDPGSKFQEVIDRFGPENIVYCRGDENLEDWPGKYVLDKNNIEIKLFPYTKEVSSTKIKEDLLND